MSQYTKPKLKPKSSSETHKLTYPLDPKAGYIKMDESKNEFRFRVADPKRFVSFYTLPSKDYEGLYYVKGVDRNGNHITQSVRFKKDLFTKKYAQKFMAKRYIRKQEE
jgi:hypothetical protein